MTPTRDEMADVVTVIKCTVVLSPSKRLEACSALRSLVTNKHNGLGIDWDQLVNLETHKPTRERWLIRSGAHSKKGILLNFCPMCGTELMDLFSTVRATPPTPEPQP